MENEKVIEMLMKQNERLMQIIETFASKENHITVTAGNPVVNSYNGSNATAEADNTTTNRNKTTNNEHGNFTTNNNN